MQKIALHFLDARGCLSSDRGWMTDCMLALHGRSSALMRIGSLDVVVSGQGPVLAEDGIDGYSQPGTIFLTVDPGNPKFRESQEVTLARAFLHELHHVVRWDGPGYGLCLGEALVSEGLAGHFVQEVLGGKPEPWEALPDALVDPHRRSADDEWDNALYDHGAWFFGTGALPRWLGYSLGFGIVARYLRTHPGLTAASVAHAPAGAFRSFQQIA
jgi:uncharacterized protein YjaZ